ncbi:MAG: tetratricopeptide repeat protein, partial [Chitinophagales bacterium]
MSNPSNESPSKNQELLEEARKVLDMGKFQKAIDATLPLIPLFVNAQEWIATSNAHAIVSIGYNFLGKIDSAIQYAERGIQILEKESIRGTAKVTFIYSSLANCYENKGLYKKAIRIHEQLLKFNEEGLQSDKKQAAIQGENIATSHYAIGNLYISLGNYDDALLHFQKSLAICEQYKGEFDWLRIAIYSSIGIVYGRKENYEQAIHFQLKAMPLAEENFGALHPHTIAITNNLGRAHLSSQQFEEALVYFQKTLEKLNPTKSSINPRIAASYRNIGMAYIGLKNYLVSIEYFEKAKQIHQQSIGLTNSPLGINDFYLGKAHQALQSFEKALQYYQTAICLFAQDFSPKASHIYQNPNLQSYEEPLQAIELLEHKAQTLSQLFHTQTHVVEDLQAALDTVKTALTLLDSTKKNYHIEDTQLFAAAKAQNLYAQAISYGSQLQKLSPKSNAINELFSYSEKAKAAILLSSLKNTKAKIEAAIPPHLIEKEGAIRIELNYLNKQITKEKAKGEQTNQTQVDALQNQYFDYHEQHRQLIQQFEAEYPEYFRLKYDDSTASIEALQKQISTSTLLIEYFIAENHLYIFTISKQNFEVLQIEKPQGFNKIIQNFNKSIRQIRKKKYVDLGCKLYRLLIEPVLQGSQTQNFDQLIIIPDGILSTLPFEALLCVAPDIQEDYTDFDYLLMHYSVSYHYSATLWLHIVQNQSHRNQLTNSFIGFAPVYKNDSSAPTPRLQKKNAEVAFRSVKIGENDYQELIYSEQEVNGVKTAFEASGLEATTLLHSESTKTNFEKSIQNQK